MGDEQPLVGNQQRRCELAAQTGWAMGWAPVGLDRGDNQMRSPDGRLLFCNGLGRGTASGTQWVLKSRTTHAPNHFHAPLPLPPLPPSFLAFVALLTPVPAAFTRVPVYRRLRFAILFHPVVGELWSER